MDKASLIYRSDDDKVLIEPGVVQLPDGGYMPVNYRIGSISPVRDDRQSDEQILEHITRRPYVQEKPAAVATMHWPESAYAVGKAG